MHHDPESILKNLGKDRDEITTGIDKDNKKKEYLDKSIKELTAKKNEIDKIVGDYEKEFNNITEKNSEFKDYVERKEHITDSLGDKRQKIEKIVKEENEKVSPTEIELDDLQKALPAAKTKLKESQRNLTIKQENYEDSKAWLKNYQKEFQSKLKRLDELKKSIDDYVKKSELEETYFFTKESTTFSNDLQKYLKEPSGFKSDLVEKWKAINVEMANVHDSEESLRTIQNNIEVCQQKLIGLKEERLSNILKNVADLGICETDKTDETAKTYES